MGQRRRRWAGVLQMLYNFFTFAGNSSWSGDDYKPTLTQCLLNVGPASPVLASRHSVLISTSFCGCMHAGGAVTMLWTKAGLMLARRLWQRGVKHETVTQYWANVDVDGGPTIARHWVNVSCLTACRIDGENAQTNKWSVRSKAICLWPFPIVCDHLRRLSTICDRLRPFALVCDHLRSFATICDR